MSYKHFYMYMTYDVKLIPMYGTVQQFNILNAVHHYIILYM